MKGNLQVIVTTVVLFLAGILIGIWSQRTAPFPPPPIGPMGEFGGFSGHDFGRLPPLPPPWFLEDRPGGRLPSAEEVRKRMAVIMPQFEAFQKQVESIEQDFRNAFETTLIPDQKQKLEVIEQRLASLPDPLPGCGPEMGPVFVSMIIYRPLYERMAEDLALTEEQRQKLKQLLIERRNKLLALVDNTPPPSFKLGEMGAPQGRLTP
jgi:hypothetical protein